LNVVSSNTPKSRSIVAIAATFSADQFSRSVVSIGTSTGTPACSMRAAATMNRPRSKARSMSSLGSITASNFSNATTSLSQYSSSAARSAPVHGPPRIASCRISSLSAASMASSP
jgi:hypothetical protein